MNGPKKKANVRDRFIPNSQGSSTVDGKKEVVKPERTSSQSAAEIVRKSDLGDSIMSPFLGQKTLGTIPL